MIRASFSSKWLLMFSLGSFWRVHRYRVRGEPSLWAANRDENLVTAVTQ